MLGGKVPLASKQMLMPTFLRLKKICCHIKSPLFATPLSYIFNALFRDTPLGHVHRTQPNIQIAKYPNIWLIWLFGYLAECDEHGQVGCP